MNSLEKWQILTPFQKLPKNVGNFGNIIVVTGFEKLPKLVTLLVSCKLWSIKIDHSWVLDKNVIVPHYHHYTQNGGLKYDHRVMYKKYLYYPPVLLWDVG